jgi:hypothetical protein
MRRGKQARRRHGFLPPLAWNTPVATLLCKHMYQISRTMVTFFFNKNRETATKRTCNQWRCSETGLLLVLLLASHTEACNRWV